MSSQHISPPKLAHKARPEHELQLRPLDPLDPEPSMTSSIAMEYQSSTEMPGIKPKRRPKSSENHFEEKLLKAVDKEPDEDEMFLLSFAPILRRMSGRSKIQLKRSISNMIMDAEESLISPDNGSNDSFLSLLNM